MYSLLKAVLIVKKIDTSSLRLQAFEDIAQQSTLIRTACNAYRKTAHTPIGAGLLLMYGLKCYLTLKTPAQKNAELFCFASYPNEHKAINGLKSELKEINTVDIFISRKYLFDPSNWLEAGFYIFTSPRLYGLARKYCKNLDFMPACRVFSTVTYYLRFLRILPHLQTQGILIAHNYSPECTALAAAAHKNALKVIYTNHAHIPAKIPYLPPLLFDMAILTSEATWQRHKKKNKQSIPHFLIGYQQQESPLRLDFSSSSNVHAGIFLTALTDKEHTRKLIEKLLEHLPIASILIRLHPVSGMYENFSDIKQEYPIVEISDNSPISEDINNCDLAICGDTSAVIEILKGGCPVIYDAELDRIPFDYNGFVQGGLIMLVEKIDAQILLKISTFYRRTEWQKIMQFYDASYDNDRSQLLRKTEIEIKRLLSE